MRKIFSKISDVVGFRPELIDSLKNYNVKTLLADTSAGIVVGIVALPLAIAFAIASGVSPDKGIITAVIAGFIISTFGGSKVQIGGPTGAFIIIVSGIIEQYGMQGLMISTIIAGIILIIMGVAKLGSVIKFVPHPVIVGFTAGIALTIFSTQIKDIFGLDIPKVPSDFIEKWACYIQYFTTINPITAGLGIGSVLFIIAYQKISNLYPKSFIQKIPGSLVVIIIATLIVHLLHLDIETIGTRFGSIPDSIPDPSVPIINFEVIKSLMSPAITIAVLGAIESLLSAVVADGMLGAKHRSNTELIAQGIANIASPLFGGIPATGAIARTATNVRNGGKTPVAGIIHSIVLLLIMLFLGKYALLIPMPTLAAVLVVVSYNMSGWRLFKGIISSSKSDALILIITFFLTVIFDLTVAIYSGMILASFLFMRRMANVSNLDIITKDINEEADDPNSIKKRKVPASVEVYEVSGPFFFGAANKFRDQIDKLGRKPKVLIIRMRNVPTIDATGLNMLENLYKDSLKKGTQLVLSGVHFAPLTTMRRTGFLEMINEDNVLGNIDDALDRAREIIGEEKVGRPADFVPTVERDIPSKNKY
ncbi:MAG: sulfate permease [Ignavibacteria bacterium]|jgi:SulP family sulfate permease|nr:sulfate permease [Ignavibacteria bacterium]